MSRLFIAALTLSCSVAHADVYRCPATYPGNDAPALALSGAFVMWGERPSSGPPFPEGWLRGDEVAAQEGLDHRYGLDGDPDPKWLICNYGSRKRVKGQFRNGHEWGQYMEGGAQMWFMQLTPKTMDCNVHIREAKTRDPSKSTWTVTADCKRSDG